MSKYFDPCFVCRSQETQVPETILTDHKTGLDRGLSVWTLTVWGTWTEERRNQEVIEILEPLDVGPKDGRVWGQGEYLRMAEET